MEFEGSVISELVKVLSFIGKVEGLRVYRLFRC